MDSPAVAPTWLVLVTAAEEPRLWDEVEEGSRFDDVWPEYDRHGNRAAEYFGVLSSRHPDLQVLALDRRSAEVVGRGRTIPVRWDGTLEVHGGEGRYFEPNVWMRHEVRAGASRASQG